MQNKNKGTHNNMQTKKETENNMQEKVKKQKKTT